MKIGTFKVALCAIAVLFGASGAQATIIATYRGTVKDGVDSLGIFGTPGADLTGASYMTRFTINDGAPGAIEYLNPPYFSEIYGSFSGSEPVRGIVSINRRTFSVRGNFNSTAAAAAYPGSYADHAVLDQIDDGITITYFALVDGFSNNTPGLTPWDYHTPFSYTLHSGDIPFGDFQINRPIGAIYENLERIDFSPSSLTVSLTDSVPELSTWAMMLIGFGAVGRRLRRQTSEVVQAK